ncbi:putative sarcoplasmic/endoplasmic reticulum calcium ATPase [Myxozyma melibiosi]|uniref:P-type Na(+) transporter n=1 Tax=Myxozyma melibiosi TaxID=54550 RepID=A0ABR1FFS2_9ASCO
MGKRKSSPTHQVEYSVPPYQLDAPDLAHVLNTDPVTGLTAAAAESKVQQYGQNKLDDDSGVSLTKVILRQCLNAMGFVLILAMALSYGVNDYVEGGVITAVIILNIVVGVVQEYRAEQTIDSLKSLSSPTATVLRDGVIDHIASLNVVPGDIVDVKVGDVIPADLRLIDTMNFEADEALLTGESLPVLKDHNIVFPPDQDASVGDRINLAYSSTTVTKGRARGIVITTGMFTEIGLIAASIAGKNRKSGRSMNVRKYGPLALFKGLSLRTWDAIGVFLGLTVGTPLQRKLTMLAYVLLVIACILALIVFAAHDFNATAEVTIYAVSLGIAIIPESLIAVLTITMAVGMKRMSKKHVIVRKLDALEALGGVTNICSDKTGTLTQGNMLAQSAWIPGTGRYDVSGSESPFDPTSGSVTLEPLSGECSRSTSDNQIPEGGLERLDVVETRDSDATTNPEELDEKKSSLVHVSPAQSMPPISPNFALFLEACALCNLATVRFDPEKKSWVATGDPTEIALQVLAHRFQCGKETLIRKGWTQLAEYPFDSDVKRMSVIFEGPSQSGDRGEVVVLSKGAVERIINLCQFVGEGDQLRPLNEEISQEVLDTASELADQGLRVLAIARRVEINPKPSYLDFPRESVEKEFTLLGLVGLCDPPRVETKGAVAQCAAAGIKIHMLTGDHPSTAQAIAKEVGIIPNDLGTLSPSVARTLVMTASQFDALSDKEIDELEVLPSVIARCAPQTKVRMIQALHRRKKYVAMTGDGVNDSPSLKMADVGIAMGMGGSDVAKAASDLVLTDDNFASIVSAIEEGRRMFDNIQKFILHLLASNVAEVVLLVLGLIFKDSTSFSVFGLAPLQILWINMLTSPGPAFGLSLEPASKEAMRRPPHNGRKGVFTYEIIVDTFIYGLVMGGCCLGAFCIVVYGKGDGKLGDDCNESYNDTCDVVFRARAAVFSLLTWLILISAWEYKNLRRSLLRLNIDSTSRFPFFRDIYANKFLFYSVMLGMVSVFPVIYIPKLNSDVFKMKPITWEWALSFSGLIVFILVVEFWKAVKRKMGWFAYKSPNRAESNIFV